jgi:hypothetical protein
MNATWMPLPMRCRYASPYSALAFPNRGYASRTIIIGSKYYRRYRITIVSYRIHRYIMTMLNLTHGYNTVHVIITTPIAEIATPHDSLPYRESKGFPHCRCRRPQNINFPVSHNSIVQPVRRVYIVPTVVDRDDLQFNRHRHRIVDKCKSSFI